MTSAYLEAARSSRRSIGGSVMPMGSATVPDTVAPVVEGGGDCRSVYSRGQTHQRDQLVRGAPDVVVDHHVVELGLGRHLDLGGREPPRALLRVLRAAADEPADQLLHRRRGEEHELGLGHRRPDLARALQVDLQQRGLPGGQPLLDGPPGGAVAVPAVHHRPLEQLAPGDHAVELLGRHEVVVQAVDLARPRGPGRGRHGEPDLRVPRPEVGGHGALADGGRSGEDGQPGARRRHTVWCSWSCAALGPGSVGPTGHPNRSTSAFTWCGPRPRTRRVSEIPISEMIWRALTLPTPGRDSSRASTLSLPMVSSFWPWAITSDSVPCEYFSRFLTSARAWRAAAAFSSAAARCSGVRVGSAT